MSRCEHEQVRADMNRHGQRAGMNRHKQVWAWKGEGRYEQARAGVSKPGQVRTDANRCEPV